MVARSELKPLTSKRISRNGLTVKWVANRFKKKNYVAKGLKSHGTIIIHSPILHWELD